MRGDTAKAIRQLVRDMFPFGMWHDHPSGYERMIERNATRLGELLDAAEIERLRIEASNGALGIDPQEHFEQHAYDLSPIPMAGPDEEYGQVYETFVLVPTKLAGEIIGILRASGEEGLSLSARQLMASSSSVRATYGPRRREAEIADILEGLPQKSLPFWGKRP